MKIKVCSFNTRTEGAKDGINCFDNRAERIIEVIEREKPDVIGFQEPGSRCSTFLKEKLKDYTVLGCGRCAEYNGEGVRLAFLRDKFDLVSFETFWLSVTPAVPNSTYGGDQSGCPRTAQIAKLVPSGGGTPFNFCNTHLDHKGADAKKFGMMQIMQRLMAEPYKFVLTGDFNSVPDSAPIELITTCTARKITDATANLVSTFHGFGTREAPYKIDYIFTDGEPSGESYTAEDEHPDGIYYSDHNAVFCEIEL